MSHTSTKMAILGAATTGLLLLGAGSAGAQTGGGTTTHFSQFAFQLPPMPDASCDVFSGAWIVWTSGHGVSHGELNNNGDWGGGTITGSAQLFSPDGSTMLDQGRATGWEGGGNNAAGQGEFGMTIDFQGALYSLHADMHMTSNNAGTLTAAVDHAHC